MTTIDPTGDDTRSALCELEQAESVYISGPMRGYDEYNYPAFNRVENILCQRTLLKVLNPARFFAGQVGLPHETYMRPDIEAVLASEAIVMLPGWKDSVGARTELLVALNLGLPAFEWVGPVDFEEPSRDEPLVERLDIVAGDLLAYLGPVTRVTTLTNAQSFTFPAAPAGVLNIESVTLVDGSQVWPVESAEPESILQEADRLVSTDRGSAYGHPFDDFTKTARMWAPIFGLETILPEQVALAMMCVKISRELNKPKRDNRVDIVGYAKCLDMVVARRAELEGA